MGKKFILHFPFIFARGFTFLQLYHDLRYTFYIVIYWIYINKQSSNYIEYYIVLIN